MITNTYAIGQIASFLGIEASAITQMGCATIRNGMDEPVSDMSVVIEQAWRHFWVNEYTGNVREYSWDRER